jgi:hypothetical protein
VALYARPPLALLSLGAQEVTVPNGAVAGSVFCSDSQTPCPLLSLPYLEQDKEHGQGIRLQDQDVTLNDGMRNLELGESTPVVTIERFVIGRSHQESRGNRPPVPPIEYICSLVL